MRRLLDALTSGRVPVASLFAGVLEFFIALLPDEGGATFEKIVWSDVPESAVQAYPLVMVNKPRDNATSVLGGVRGGRTNGVGFERLMPPLQLAVGLGVVGRGPDVGHAWDSEEFFEVLGNKLGSVVADDSRAGLGELLPSALEDALDVALRRGLAELPMHNGTARLIMDRAEVIERACNIDIRDVDVPMLVWCEGCTNWLPFFEGRLFQRSRRPALERTRR
jgi:hypothetical protein